METENKKISIQEKYAEIAKNSLVRVQYSCSGNSDCIDASDLLSDENLDETQIAKSNLDTEKKSTENE